MTYRNYDATRPLIDQVTEVLQDLGHAEPGEWKEYAEAFIPMAADTTQEPAVQRYYINRCLRMYMCESAVDSTDVRTHLFDDGAIIDWFRHFQQEVAPWLVKNTPLKIS